jgi:hypothetical protein
MDFFSRAFLLGGDRPRTGDSRAARGARRRRRPCGWRLVAADAARLADPGVPVLPRLRPLGSAGQQVRAPAPGGRHSRRRPRSLSIPDAYFNRGDRGRVDPVTRVFGHSSDRRYTSGERAPTASIGDARPGGRHWLRTAVAPEHQSLGNRARLRSVGVNSRRARNGHESRFAPARTAAKVTVTPLESFEWRRSERETTNAA